MTQDAKEILEKYQKIVWPKIQRYLKKPAYPKIFEIPPKYSKHNDFQWKIICDYPERKGKYLRPTLVMLTARSMGVSAANTLQTAAGMQLSEEWILNHDDWEDNSRLRRGKPALHRLYGPELAVNAGDALHVIMWKVFLDNSKILGYEKSWEIMNEFYVMLMRTTTGQGVEIKITKDNLLKFSDNDWYFIADGKTSYYTVATPMRLGAILANASKKQLDRLAEFGVYLGRCFQLVDDILDVTSDFSGLKQFGNDIYEGKRTMLLGHLLRKIKSPDRNKLLKILAKERDSKTENEVNWVIDKMNEYGSIKYAKNRASKLRDHAYEIFKNDLKFLKKEPYRGQLETLIHFILERTY